MNVTQTKLALQRGDFNEKFSLLYGDEGVAAANERYRSALTAFAAEFGEALDVSLFSVSGRSELSGNHTDHNHGCVVATSIDLDIIAVAAPTSDAMITVRSEGYPRDVVDISQFSTPDRARFGTSASLIAGMAQGFLKNGYQAGGFVAYTTSNVLKGSGLSSSAAFEVSIGNILNHLYNGGRVDNVKIAKLAQYAENEFFGKPCGLMDQMACAVGGIIAIDFAEPKSPAVEKIDFDMTSAGYRVCIVNTGGNHADLTPEYAAIPGEMKAVAAKMGANVLRNMDQAAFFAAIPQLRTELGDRAILRALHFLFENERVMAQTKALQRGDLDTFLAEAIASGRSSFCYLQNVFSTANPAEQGLSLALCLAEQYLSDKKGAWRVHGGGFAGTVLAFLREEDVAGFTALMDGVFGKGACIPLRVRTVGAIKI